MSPAAGGQQQSLRLQTNSAKPVGVGAASQRTIWIADAHRDDGKRYVVRAGEKLAAFVELEAAIWTHSLGRTYE